MIKLNYKSIGTDLIKGIYQKIRDYHSINPLEYNESIDYYTMDHVQKLGQDSILDYVDIDLKDLSRIEFSYNIRQDKFLIDLDRKVIDKPSEPYVPEWPVIIRYALNDNYTFKIIGSGINPEYLYRHYEWFHNVIDLLINIGIVLKPKNSDEYYFKFNVEGLLNL